MPSEDDIAADISRFLTYRQPHHKTPQISFYGGTFLGIGKKNILAFLGVAERFVLKGQAASIRFSTRPDTITPAALDLIRHFPVKTIELGVQSMDDAVLEQSRRGHTAFDTRRGVRLLKERGYAIGLQMMVGLPGQDASSAMTTALDMARLSPDFVRIYPTIVLKNSRLEEWYRKGTYEPLSLKTAISQVKDIYRFFREKQIPVIRMGLQASESLDLVGTVVSGPYHPAFGHLVLSACFLEKAEDRFNKLSPRSKKITLRVHPRSESRMRGHQNENLEILKHRFGPASIQIVLDSRLSEEELQVAAD